MDTARLFLAATDFSDDAFHAAVRACLLARQAGAGVELLHVVGTDALTDLRRLFSRLPDIETRLRDEAEQELRSLAGDVAAKTGTRPEPRVTEGDVDDEIAAAAEHARLLAVGAHGSTGLGDLLLGSVAERVVRKARPPVLVVRRPAGRGYERVLVAVAFGLHSENALRSAIALAPHAEITVLHSVAVPYESTLRLAGVSEPDIEEYRSGARAEALQRLEALLATMGTAANRFGRRVEHGDAAHLILRVAEEQGADLIVMGKQGESALRNALLGSVARHVLSAAACDVLAVGAEPFETTVTGS